MEMQVPKWEKPKEVFAKNIVFWHKPSIVKRIDALCDVSHIDRSEVLRALVDLFLNDYAFQNSIMELVRRNHV